MFNTRGSMKTFMKYFLVSVISLAIGGVMGWKAFRDQIKARAIPFDRTQYRNLHLDLTVHQPTIDFHVSPDGNTFRMWGGAVKGEEDFDRQLVRVASFSTSCWVCVSFNSDVTVQQIRDMDARIRSFGFSSPKMLIEDNWDTRTEGETRLFSDIKIGPSNTFYQQNVEWFIDAEQEEATKRMINQKGKTK